MRATARQARSLGAIGGRKDANALELGMLRVLNLSDGEYSLLDIAERSGYEFGIAMNMQESCSITKY